MGRVKRKISLTYFICLGMLFSSADLHAFSIPAPLPGESQSIQIAGSTVIVRGVTDQVNRAFINGHEVAVGRDGTFYEELIVPIGQTEVEVRVVDPQGMSSSHMKNIVAKSSHFFLAGIADSTLNFVNASTGYSLKRDNESMKAGTQIQGKVSYYFAGKIEGKYLIKSSLDTDKATQEKLFTNIDPDKYYPIYGDDSSVTYDVNSQGKFYLLVEWDKSGFVIGNFQTQMGDENAKLATFNRTLYGSKFHYESPERTVYGDAKTEGAAFVAKGNQRSGHSELLATGGSLYYLRHRNIAEGSEQVRLDIRDKNTGITIRSIPQAENQDYEIKYDEGRILFKRPVSSTAGSDTVISDGIQEGNEVYVVVNYEYQNQEAFTVLNEDLDQATGGGRVSHSLGDHVRVGTTYLEEHRDGKDHGILGADTTLRFGNFTKLNLEFAKSRANTSDSFLSYNGGYDYTDVGVQNLTKGHAFRTEFNSTIGEFFGKGREFLDVSGYWTRIGRNFSPTDGLFEAGTRKYGFELGHRLTPFDKFRLIYEDGTLDDSFSSVNPAAEQQLQASRVQTFTAQWAHDWKKYRFYTEYRAETKKLPLGTVRDVHDPSETDHVIAEKVEYRMSDATTFFLGQQIGISESEDAVTSAGVEQKVTQDYSVYLRGAAGKDQNSVKAGVEHQADAKTSEYMNYTIANSALDGRVSTTTYGSSTRLSNSADIRREKQFVTSDLRGTYTSDVTGYHNNITPEMDLDASYEHREQALDALKGSMPRNALSGTLTYAKPDRFKSASKFEYRYDTGNDQLLLFDNQGEWKVARDWSLLGEYEYSQGQDDVRSISVSRIDKKQIGFAYRPVDFDWFNALFRYTHLEDDRPHDLTSADGGFMQWKSAYDELAGEAAIDLPWNFQFVEKVAYRTESAVAIDANGVIETPSSYDAILILHRLNYHITGALDAALEVRSLRLDGSDVNTLETGPLAEFTYWVHKNVGLGAGYNFTSFKDDFTVLDKKRAEGFFLRLQGKY